MKFGLSKFTKFLFLFLILLLITIISASFTILLLPPIHEEIRVPNVVGKDFEAAFHILTTHKLRVKKVARYSDIVPAGYIIEQSPSPGRNVREGREIRLIVSKGKLNVLVPDVEGMPLLMAKNAIRDTMDRMGRGALRIGYIAHVHSEDVNEGVVMAQSPFPMTTVPRGTRVSLLVSLGPWPRRIEDKPEDLVIAPVWDPVEEERSNGDTLGDSKSFDIIRFIVPAGLDYKQVRISLIDEEGERRIYDQQVRPGEFLEVPVERIGEAKVKIFVDGELYEERDL